MTPPAEDAAREIEIVARAIATADEQNGQAPYEYRITLSRGAKGLLFDQARAAIEAMKPTLLAASEAGRAEERAAVVAWLRWQAKIGHADATTAYQGGALPQAIQGHRYSELIDELANALERGDHIAKEP